MPNPNTIRFTVIGTHDNGNHFAEHVVAQNSTQAFEIVDNNPAFNGADLIVAIPGFLYEGVDMAFTDSDSAINEVKPLEILVETDYENGNVAQVTLSKDIDANVYVADHHAVESRHDVYPTAAQNTAWLYKSKTSFNIRDIQWASTLAGLDLELYEGFSVELSEDKTTLTLTDTDTDTEKTIDVTHLPLDLKEQMVEDLKNYTSESS